MSLLVLKHPALDDARCTIHSDALPEFTARGWEVVGEGMSPLSTVTVTEQTAADLVAAADVEAALATDTVTTPGDGDGEQLLEEPAKPKTRARRIT